MSRRFRYQALPMRVRFGAGVLRALPDEAAELGISRALVLCSPEQEDTGRAVVAALGLRAAGLFPHARMHVPIDVARRARTTAAELGADAYVAVGGGSAIGLGKAIALEHEQPVVAVPTTYAGSEMTPIWGVTEAGEKRTGRDSRVLPRSVLYDPELTLTLPPALSVTSGVNAIAHAVEGLYAPDRSPIVSLMAAEGVRALAAALPGVVSDGGDLESRSEALYGAWLCGAVLGQTTMSLHHRLCHALGGTLDLPHAETHTVVLPHVMAFNLPAAPEALTVLGHALGGVRDPARELQELTVRLGAPRSLAELGMAEADIPRIADQVSAGRAGETYANPRPVTHQDAVALLHAAWAGEAPASQPL